MSVPGARSTTGLKSLNEYSPIVSIENAVSNQYRFVDFDYEAFAEEAEKLGISPEEQGALSVIIMPKIGLGIGRGTYNKAKKRLTAVARPTINKHFMHELKHAADATTGDLHHDRRFWVGKIGLAGSIPAMIAPLAAIGEYIAGNDAVGNILNGVGLAGSVACAAAVIYGYVRHPDEIRADEVAEQSHAQIVKLTPAPGHIEPMVDMVQEADAAFKRWCRSY